MTLDSKQGPLTAADLQAIWEGAVDRSYREPLLKAGEGQGLEVYGQAFAQCARLSRAIDSTTQELYLQPWSGQSDVPAQGPSCAIVALALQRLGYAGQCCVMRAGQFIDEQQNDHGPDGSVPTVTGRRYRLMTDVAWAPGDTTIQAVEAIAERAGAGYNNPMPGSITMIENVGTGLHHGLGTLAIVNCGGNPSGQNGLDTTANALGYVLTAYNETDMFVPANVGQSVLFVGGANAGRIALVERFIAPRGEQNSGSAVVLAPILAFESYQVLYGPFCVGQPVQLIAPVPSVNTTIAADSDGVTLPQPVIHVASSIGFPPAGTVVVDGSIVYYTSTTSTSLVGCTGGTATLHAGDFLISPEYQGEVASGVLMAVSSDGTRFTVLVQQGNATGAVQMQQLHAPPSTYTMSTANVSVVLQDATLTPEAPTGSPLSGGASWRVLDWARDWQLTVTNAASPCGGNLGMLDLHGAERDLPRQRGEIDADYRDRIWNLPDVVTPNAIKRALNRTLVDQPWCYRETTNGLLPGVFYDRGLVDGALSGGDPHGDFYDNDMLLWEGVGSGTFVMGEPVQYQQQVPAGSGPWCCLATGLFGGFLDAIHPTRVIRFVRKSGQAIDPVTGDRIIGMQSGATFMPASSIPCDPADVTRWNVLLDYLDMRAYFAVELPRVGYGEFGFAYDDHPVGAYDATSALDFYDGFPAGSAKLYGPVAAQLDKIRAGGVTVGLFLQDGPCI